MAPSKTRRTPDVLARETETETMLDSERDRIFGDWLAAHRGILFKVVRAYAFKHADRQDLFQEIAIQVWRSVDSYRGDSSVPTWMYRIALNAAISWTRKQDRHQRGKQPLEIVEGLLTVSGAEPDPRVDWLYRRIAQLKDVDRSVALLMLWTRTCFIRRCGRNRRGSRGFSAGSTYLRTPRAPFS